MAVSEPILTRLSWSTSVDPALWAHASEIGRGASPGVAHADEPEVGVVEVGPALPEHPEARISSLTLIRDLPVQRLHWVLQLSSAPTDPPPDEIIKANQRFGGLAGLRSLVAEGLSNGPASALLRSSAALPAARWMCPLLSGGLLGFEDPIRGLDPRAKREQVGYRFEDGPSGLREVSVVFDHLNMYYVLAVVARLAWRPASTGWLNEDALLIDLMSRTMFVMNGGP